jgi:hypothetical protein
MKVQNMNRIFVFFLFNYFLINAQETIDELREHTDTICMDPEHKHYEKLTLAYVTPWYCYNLLIN